MKYSQALMGWVLCAAPLAAADLPIAGAGVPVPQYSFAKLTVELKPGDLVRWKVFPQPVRIEQSGGDIYLSAAPGAQFTVFADVFNFDTKRLDGGQVSLMFAGVTPPPVPPTPVPPGPTPPTPGPDVVPIPLPGLRVMVVYEAADVTKYTAGQQSVLYSTTLRDYVKSKTPNGFRCWDKDTDATGDAAEWQAALKRPRTATPWLIVSNGKAGYEGPITPTMTADEAMALIKKYGE